ncbi:DUF3800 domain-containing protein [Clavibacter michiganensis]|uniref:DUF3800 domain-containing protein n=1 Tax=Clavibacter michiganensis TaxID=28447 RepID=UPI003DA1B87A
MLTAYLDESYNDDFYFIGAALGTSEVWDRVSEGYSQIRQHTHERHATPEAAEFHGHELMGGSGDWLNFRGKHREAAGTYAAALDVARRAGVVYIFRGMDRVRHRERYSNPYPPHGIVLAHLLERINDHHRQHCGPEEPGVRVVADDIATHEEHQREFRSYQTLGTPGYRSSILERIQAPIEFASSAENDGLQAADMAVYLHRRRHTIRETHPKAANAMARLCAQIDPLVAHKLIWEP